MNEELILMMIKLIVGAFATLFAILLWARTRDTAWMLVIVSAIFSYGYLFLETLQFFGLLSLDFANPILSILIIAMLENLPPLLLIIALIIMIRRKT